MPQKYPKNANFQVLKTFFKIFFDRFWSARKNYIQVDEFYRFFSELLSLILKKRSKKLKIAILGGFESFFKKIFARSGLVRPNYLRPVQIWQKFWCFWGPKPQKSPKIFNLGV